VTAAARAGPAWPVSARLRRLVLSARLWRWATLLAMAGAWEAWARLRRSTFFPPPSAVLTRMYRLWFSGPATHLFLTPDATGNLLPSLARVLAGLAIAVAAGGVVGLALGRSATVFGYLDPLLQFGRALPAVTLVPVFIAIFKIGTQMEVATIAFGTVWPILLNTADGARYLDLVQVETARAFRLPARLRLIRLIIPAALPKFFAGLRLSVSLALILMVFAELAGSSNGLGYEMNNAESSFDMTWLWSTLVLVAILGNLLNLLELAVEHRLLAWHRGARQHPN
jgi:ABC-type nitrate/sulfonate/bicarbonate transport system permease component